VQVVLSFTSLVGDMLLEANMYGLLKHEPKIVHWQSVLRKMYLITCSIEVALKTVPSCLSVEWYLTSFLCISYRSDAHI